MSLCLDWINNWLFHLTTFKPWEPSTGWFSTELLITLTCKTSCFFNNVQLVVPLHQNQNLDKHLQKSNTSEVLKLILCGHRYSLVFGSRKSSSTRWNTLSGFQGTTNWSASSAASKRGQKHASLEKWAHEGTHASQLEQEDSPSTTSLWQVLGWLLGAAVHHLNSFHQLVKDPYGLKLPLSQQQFPLLCTDSLTHLLLFSESHLVHCLGLSLCFPAKHVKRIS